MLLPSGNPFKCHKEVLYLQPMLPPKRFDIFPPDWGMLIRSRRVQIFILTIFRLRLRIRKKRYLPNAKADSIAAFLRDLASRWEMQPDLCEIHSTAHQAGESG